MVKQYKWRRLQPTLTMFQVTMGELQQLAIRSTPHGESTMHMKPKAASANNDHVPGDNRWTATTGNQKHTTWGKYHAYKTEGGFSQQWPCSRWQQVNCNWQSEAHHMGKVPCIWNHSVLPANREVEKSMSAQSQKSSGRGNSSLNS